MGGQQNGRGVGQVKFYPYKKGEGRGEKAMLKGWGHKLFWGSFNTRASSFSRTEGEGHKLCPLFNSGATRSLATSGSLCTCNVPLAMFYMQWCTLDDNLYSIEILVT